MIYNAIRRSDQQAAAVLVAHHLRGDREGGLEALMNAVTEDRMGQLVDGVLTVIDSIVDPDRREEVADYLSNLAVTLAADDAETK